MVYMLMEGVGGRGEGEESNNVPPREVQRGVSIDPEKCKSGGVASSPSKVAISTRSLWMPRHEANTKKEAPPSKWLGHISQ